MKTGMSEATNAKAMGEQPANRHTKTAPKRAGDDTGDHKGPCYTRCLRPDRRVGDGIGCECADPHDPGLGIDPLKARRFQETDGLGGGCALAALGCCDAPGQIHHIGRPNIFQRQMQPRQRGDNRAKPKPNREHHGGKTDNDAKHMRHGAAKAEIGAGRREHGVVWARRDACGQGETKQRPEKRVIQRGCPRGQVDKGGVSLGILDHCGNKRVNPRRRRYPDASFQGIKRAA